MIRKKKLVFLYLCRFKVRGRRRSKANVVLLPTHRTRHRVKIRSKRDPGDLAETPGDGACRSPPRSRRAYSRVRIALGPGHRPRQDPSSPVLARVSGLPFDKRFRIRAGHAAQDDGGGGCGAEGLLLTASSSCSCPNESREILVPRRRPRHPTPGGHDHRQTLLTAVAGRHRDRPVGTVRDETGPKKA